MTSPNHPARPALSEAEREILAVVAVQPCLPWTLSDILNPHVQALRTKNLIETYWGIGGTHWTITNAGRAALAAEGAGR